MNFIRFFWKDWKDGEIRFMAYIASSFSDVELFLLHSSGFVSFHNYYSTNTSKYLSPIN